MATRGQVREFWKEVRDLAGLRAELAYAELVGAALECVRSGSPPPARLARRIARFCAEHPHARETAAFVLLEQGDGGAPEEVQWARGVLGLGPQDGRREARARFSRAIRDAHPDTGSGPEDRIEELTRAWAIVRVSLDSDPA